MVIDEMTVRTFSTVILLPLSSHTTLNVQFSYNSIFCGIQAKHFQDKSFCFEGVAKRT